VACDTLPLGVAGAVCCNGAGSKEPCFNKFLAQDLNRSDELRRCYIGHESFHISSQSPVCSEPKCTMVSQTLKNEGEVRAFQEGECYAYWMSWGCFKAIDESKLSKQDKKTLLDETDAVAQKLHNCQTKTEPWTPAGPPPYK
jgi:hypothetical protein